MTKLVTVKPENDPYGHYCGLANLVMLESPRGMSPLEVWRWLEMKKPRAGRGLPSQFSHPSSFAITLR